MSPRPLIIGGIAATLVLVLGWVAGGAGALGWALPLAILIGVLTFTNAWFTRAHESGGGRAGRASFEVVGDQRLDMSDELLDLCKSAREHAIRWIEDHKGPVEPFVMFEDRDGNVRVRRPPQGEPGSEPARARETARALETDVVRVVIAYPGTARRGDRGKMEPAIGFEAAERSWKPRTLQFIQRYRGRALIRPAEAVGRAVFLGEAPHTLLFPQEWKSPLARGVDPWADPPRRAAPPSQPPG